MTTSLDKLMSASTYKETPAATTTTTPTTTTTTTTTTPTTTTTTTSPASQITTQMVDDAIHTLAAYELAEKAEGKDDEDALFYSKHYFARITSGNGIAHNGCTQAGVYTVASGNRGKIVEKNPDGTTTEKDMAQALADSYDSPLDLLVEETFSNAIAEFGHGSAWTYQQGKGIFTNANMKKMLEKYGLQITEVESNTCGQNRTYCISFVDGDGNVIKDAEGNEASILWGDWVIPDGNAQGAELNMSSILDTLGYDCISKADFMTNEELGGAEGYHDLLDQARVEIDKIRNGETSQYCQKGDRKPSEIYGHCEFKWGNVTGRFSSSSNGGSYASGGVLDALKAEFGESFDFDKYLNIVNENSENMNPEDDENLKNKDGRYELPDEEGTNNPENANKNYTQNQFDATYGKELNTMYKKAEGTITSESDLEKFINETSKKYGVATSMIENSLSDEIKKIKEGFEKREEE